ncbi:MAG: cytochrome c-type biogenesis protein CcmH [Anaerolineales bacterium]|nr:cytochrome c-type biogenesis protein CcmH [Anaerolineales bacterium]
MLALLAVMLVSLVVVPNALAQDPTPQPPVDEITDDQVNAIAEDMYCPVCENIPLDVCGTVACQQWRDEIRLNLAEGLTEEEIQDLFVTRYGDRVLAEPPRRGFNWLIYIVPPVVIALAAFLLYRGLRSWRKPLTQAAASPEEEPPAVEDEYTSRLEAELKNRT